jgi:fructokinase
MRTFGMIGSIVGLMLSLQTASAAGLFDNKEYAARRSRLMDNIPDGAAVFRGAAPANFAFHTGALGAEAYVVSRVGAGDAFTAPLVIGVLQGKDFDAINEEANRLAGAVCTRSGAMSAFPPSGKHV